MPLVGVHIREKSYGIARWSGTVRTPVRCEGRAQEAVQCRVPSISAGNPTSAFVYPSSEEVANRLIVMARDYQTKADAMDAELRSALPTTIADDWNQIE
jgi:hypothetical protein